VTRWTGLSKANLNEYMSKAEYSYKQALESGKGSAEAEKAQSKVA
jgi:hypothetical protein